MPQSQQREQRRELSDAASGELTHEAGATRRPLSKNSLWRQMRAGIAVGGTLAASVACESGEPQSNEQVATTTQAIISPQISLVPGVYPYIYFHPVGINNAGLVVGNMGFSDNGLTTRPGVFQVDNSASQTIGGLGSADQDIYATGINNQGQVSGSSPTFSGPTYYNNPMHAFRWENGVTSDIGGPCASPSQGNYYGSFGKGINNLGIVVGSCAVVTEQRHKDGGAIAQI